MKELKKADSSKEKKRFKYKWIFELLACIWLLMYLIQCFGSNKHFMLDCLNVFFGVCMIVAEFLGRYGFYILCAVLFMYYSSKVESFFEEMRRDIKALKRKAKANVMFNNFRYNNRSFSDIWVAEVFAENRYHRKRMIKGVQDE